MLSVPFVFVCGLKNFPGWPLPDSLRSPLISFSFLSSAWFSDGARLRSYPLSVTPCIFFSAGILPKICVLITSSFSLLFYKWLLTESSSDKRIICDFLSNSFYDIVKSFFCIRPPTPRTPSYIIFPPSVTSSTLDVLKFLPTCESERFS